MSYSKLYVCNQTGIVEDEIEYSNSWLFSPIVWDLILHKFMSKDELILSSQYNIKKSLINSSEEIFPLINDRVNKCDDIVYRTMWELSCQQIFYVKDNKFVASCIRKFVEENIETVLLFDDSPKLLSQHIQERFLEIAKDIDNIDSSNKYFVLKNTSVDDTVENFFVEYDDEREEYIERTLDDFLSSSNRKVDLVTYLDNYNKIGFL